MIKDKIDKITIDKIREIIDLKIPESKVIEYKKELKIERDSDKKEFLADVSSFANTFGGDILFGIEAKGGVPVSLSPIKVDNLDAEQLRIESIIRTGINPRISFSVKPISVENEGEYIFIIRVNESWNKPHRVDFGGSHKFYARNSAGKYELDVEELRNVFGLSSRLLDKINDFRVSRILELESVPDSFLLNHKEDGKVVLHIVPLSSFSDNVSTSTQELVNMYMNRSVSGSVADDFHPMQASGWSHKVTAKGIMSYSGNEHGIRSYTELYKNGIVEAVLCDIVGINEKGDRFLFMRKLELILLEYIPKYLNLQSFLNIQTPLYIFITIAGVKKTWLRNSSDSYRTDYPIEKNILYLPEVVLQSYDDNLENILKPSFDIVWNNAGIVQSDNYDRDGNFNVR